MSSPQNGDAAEGKDRGRSPSPPDAAWERGTEHRSRGDIARASSPEEPPKDTSEVVSNGAVDYSSPSQPRKPLLNSVHPIGASAGGSAGGSAGRTGCCGIVRRKAGGFWCCATAVDDPAPRIRRHPEGDRDEKQAEIGARDQACPSTGSTAWACNGSAGFDCTQEARADFSGSWRCVKVDGEIDRFLADMGLNEILREEACRHKYGAGMQEQHITQSVGSFEIENILKVPIRMKFVADGGVQKSVDQAGRPILIDPCWDGPALLVKSMREDGELIAHTRRYIENDVMVLELTSPQGSIVRRVFDRVP